VWHAQPVPSLLREHQPVAYAKPVSTRALDPVRAILVRPARHQYLEILALVSSVLPENIC
jgi:hypothetical protein